MPSPTKRNIRHEIRQTLAAKPAKVRDSGTGKVTLKTLAFNQEPGHRDLGLISKPVKGYANVTAPKAAGAFSGVTKAERARRRAEREAQAANLAQL